MSTRRHQWELRGVHCANCARKIENAIRKMEGVKQASLDFANASLVVELADSIPLASAINEVEQILQRYEPGSSLKQAKKEPMRYEEMKEEHSHDEDEDQEETGANNRRIVLYAIGAVLFLFAIVLPSGSYGEIALFLMSYVIFGFTVLQKSFMNILKGQVFDENFLMSIASLGAFVLGEYPEAAAVMLFYQIGELFQDYAVDKSRRSIKKLLNIRPDYANLKMGKGYEKVPPASVRVGDQILVRPGERVPLDGTVLEGRSSLDTSPLTGESLPRDVAEGDEVYSGSVNQSGALTLRVSKDYSHSTVSRILALVEDASHKKAVSERFITRFAAWYTPIVVGLAFLLSTLPPLFAGGDFKEWIYRGLTFLVISCPCALVISIPLGFFGGIGAASRRGILVKGGNYLEALAQLDTVVFDKTGTITRGVFEVKETLPASGITDKQLLEYAAYAESMSTHPIARSIVKAYGKEPETTMITDYQEVSGEGIQARVSGRMVLCGSRRLLERNGVSIPQGNQAHGVHIFLAVDGSFAGSIVLADTVRPDSAKAIQSLKALGVKHIVMLTGDQEGPANEVAEQLGIDKVHAQLMPQDKVSVVESLLHGRTGKGKLAFVGDGINDAAVITRADIGIAMGAIGSEAAIEAADVVLMHDEPSKIAEAISLARKTRRVVVQNILLAGLVKVLVLALGAGGMATLWEAVFADVGVALLAILNAMRLIKENPPETSRVVAKN